MTLLTMLTGVAGPSTGGGGPTTATAATSALAFADAVAAAQGEMAEAPLGDAGTTADSPDAGTADAGTADAGTADAVTTDTASQAATVPLPPAPAAPVVVPVEAAPVVVPIEAAPVDEPVEAAPVENPLPPRPAQGSPMPQPVTEAGEAAEVPAAPHGSVTPQPVVEHVEAPEASVATTPLPPRPAQESPAPRPVAEPVEAAGTPVATTPLPLRPTQESPAPPPADEPAEAPEAPVATTPLPLRAADPAPDGTSRPPEPAGHMVPAHGSLAPVAEPAEASGAPVEGPLTLRQAQGSPTPPPAVLARPALLPQIAAPVVALAQAADGDHQLTLTVSPESLGPVTVKAHISGGAIRIELHAPSDLGRDALRTILTDLRRDLAVAAPHATLSLSTSGDGPGTSNTGQQSAFAGQGSTQNSGSHGGAPNASQNSASPPERGRETSAGASAPDRNPEPLPTPHGGIDVYA